MRRNTKKTRVTQVNDHAGFSATELAFFAEGNLIAAEAPQERRERRLSFWVFISVAAALALFSPYLIS